MPKMCLHSDYHSDYFRSSLDFVHCVCALHRYYDAVKDEQCLAQAAAGSHDNEVSKILKKIKDAFQEEVKHKDKFGKGFYI